MAAKPSYRLFDITLARRTQVSASLVKFTFTGPDVGYMATYAPGALTAENGGLAPDLDAETVNGTALYGVCCDRQANNTCDCDGDPYSHAA